MEYIFVLFIWVGYKGYTVQGFETYELCDKAGKQFDSSLFSGYRCEKIQIKEKKSKTCGK